MADDIEDVSFLPGLYIHYCFIKALDIEYRMTELCVHEQSILYFTPKAQSQVIETPHSRPSTVLNVRKVQCVHLLCKIDGNAVVKSFHHLSKWNFIHTTDVHWGSIVV